MDPLYLALLLYVAAVALGTVDIFVPSGGMLLILATLAAIGAVLFGFRSGTTAGMAMLTLVIASIPAFVYLAIKIWPKTPIGKRIILDLPQVNRPGEDPAGAEALRELLGRVMLTETAMLPTGQLRIGHRRFNAIAESSFIEAGSRVKVIAIRERNLVVRVTSEPLSSVASASVKGAAEEAELAARDDGQSLLDRSADELGLSSLED